MKQKLVKVLCLVLAILSVVFVSSCKKVESDIPEGMQSASVEGAPFRLYVPTNWNLNTQSGISGAYLSTKLGISVNADWIPADDGETLESFFNSCIESYQKKFENFEKTEESDIVVDSRKAKKLTFSLNYQGEKYKIMRAFVKCDNNFVIFSYKAKADYYDSYLKDAEAMLEVFRLSYSDDVVRPEEKDKNTPEGMKIASGDSVEYRLYVPENWIVNSKNSVAGAYYSDDNRSNVTLTSYSPTQNTALDDYWKQCEEKYGQMYENYSLITCVTGAELGKRPAIDNTFSFELDEIRYMQRQVMCVYADRIYTLTYTSTPENFGMLEDDVKRIINSFTFR